jgi:hypothetical protein
MITFISGQVGEGGGVNYVEETTETRYILMICDACRFGRQVPTVLRNPLPQFPVFSS